MTDEELEKLREERLKEKQKDDQARGEAVDRQKKQIWQEAKKNMSKDATERLSNIRAVNEQKAYSVAQQIVTLADSNRIGKVGEKQMKEILKELKEDEENQANIKFRN